jgi:2-aminoethylphosphonate-pyruvate transaminase
MLNMKRVSLTPAVFHLSERVNKIAEIYAEQPVVPRGPKLKPIMDRLRLKLVQQLDVADTHEAIILTAAGSGAIAATVGSCIDQQGVLIIANDIYGHRQADFCKQLDIRTIVYELDPGVKPNLSEIADLVEKHGIKTIGMVHGCTSVALMNPVLEVGAYAKEKNLRLIVDGIASVFVEEIDMNKWGIDALICSTNKGLHSNPDLCFSVVAKDYLLEMANYPGRIPYLDLYKAWSSQRGGTHPYTINIRALLEFEAALDDYIERGSLQGRINMYQDRLKILRSGYKKLGLKTFLRDGMPQQNIGTTLYLPENVTYDALAESLANWDNGDNECYEIYSAQGELSGKLFRIFNMGEYELKTYERFIHALGECIDKLSQ